MILPSLDPVKSSGVHRRLAVFGRHDDRGAVEKPALREGEYHLSKGLVDEVERVAQDRPGGRAVCEVAAFGGSRQVTFRPGSWQLLACRDALEVQAKDRWRSWVTGAIMAVTIDPVKDGLNLVFVVFLGQEIVRGPIRPDPSPLERPGSRCC